MNTIKLILLFALCASLDAFFLPSTDAQAVSNYTVSQKNMSVIEAFRFEVATLKPTSPDAMGKMFAVTENHRLLVMNRSLRDMVAIGNNLQENQIIGGPDWMRAKTFDVSALPPLELPRPTLEEWKQMLWAFLIDRFSLEVHQEQRTMSAFSLLVGSTGAHLKSSALDQGKLPDVTITAPGHLRVRNATIHDVIATLECCVLMRPVSDDTGLIGRYDFTLDWKPSDSAPNASSTDADASAVLPDVFTAFRETLGLNVRAGKQLVDVMVIDHVSAPSPN